jgi:hypothetical protein
MPSPPAECADVTVSYCGTDSGWSNVWKLLTTDCPADAIIYPSVQETTTCANGNWTFSFTGLAAGTYWLPVPNVGFGQGGGAYTKWSRHGRGLRRSAVPCE